MKALKAVVLGISITCSGAISVIADADTPAQGSGIEGATAAAADGTAPSPCDSVRVEASLLLAGGWHAAETADERKQRLEAIDEVTDDLGRLKRGKARSRLADRTSPPPSLVIEMKGPRVTIVTGDDRLELELGGSPIEVSESDAKAQVSARMECERLIVVALSDNGERTTTYRADEDGLSMEVVLTSASIAGPLRYTTTYARAE